MVLSRGGEDETASRLVPSLPSLCACAGVLSPNTEFHCPQIPLHIVAPPHGALCWSLGCPYLLDEGVRVPALTTPLHPRTDHVRFHPVLLSRLFLNAIVYVLRGIIEDKRGQRTYDLAIDKANHSKIVVKTLDTSVPVCYKNVGIAIFLKIFKNIGVVPDSCDSFKVLDYTVKTPLKFIKCLWIVLFYIRQQ